jgi:hypothetical protein
MAYTNFTNCTEEEYTNIIYSQDDKNRIRIWFNEVEVEDAGEYCVSLTGTNRILPDGTGKRFSLDNFVSKEYTLILRDLPSDIVIEDQVRISIGTLVDSENDIYEDVPIGIFNLQETPVTDQKQIELKLRDNRVKFDFNYNAEPLIESLGGTATLGDILDDICEQAGVTNNVGTFNGEDIEVSIFDNTIKATDYVSYILEQGGYIPTIDRDGSLIKIDLSNLTTHRIPLSIVEKYKIQEPYEIERVVYETGITKLETSSDETLTTLYLDSANPYITEQEQVDNIFDKLEGFRIDSATTGKVLGNPAIDPYDMIEIYDDEILPSEYTQVDYIANNGLQYINTNYKTTKNTTIKAKFMPTGVNSRNSISIYANQDSNTDSSFRLFSIGSILYAASGGNRAETSNAGFVINTLYEIEHSNTSLTINNTQRATSGGNKFVSDLRLMGDAFDSGYVFIGKLYSFKIYENDILTRDFIPCYRNSDNEVGLYDIVNGVFYTNAGTGSFSYGTKTTILKTLANNTYTFNGVHRQTFDTQIGLEERKENVSKDSEATFRKYARTSINNIDGQISLVAGDINDLEGRMSTAEATIDSQGARLDIVSTNIDDEGNVTALKRTNYEFGSNGIIIESNNFKSIKNTTGDYYYDNDTMIGKYTKDGSVQKDIALFGKYYYGIDENLDVENFTKDDAMFVAQLYVDGNQEEGFGHFYNGGGD